MSKTELHVEQKAGLASNFKDILNWKKVEIEIEVSEPQKKAYATGSFHVYKVKGKDNLGEFEVFRRFREFDLLRKVLYSRFLGLYVPPIPEKKSMVSLNRNYSIREISKINLWRKESTF